MQALNELMEAESYFRARYRVEIVDSARGVLS
jgi:hypothetical protein